MRSRAILLGLLMAICCLFLSQLVNAQTPDTYSYSTIDFDDSTGTIVAAGHTRADYQTGAYYQDTGVQSKIVDADGNQLALNRNQVYGISADVSASVDADADQEYTVLTGHWLIATYYVYNYYNYYDHQYETGYYDPYNYSFYEGQNITADEHYDFYGWGPVMVKYISDEILGQTKKKVKVGTPDHVYVVDDVTHYYDCGTPYRTLTLRSVDINGHGTGRTSIRELFSNPPIVSSCTGSSPHETQCGEAVTGSNAQFTDTISAGCPGPNTSLPCGFSITPNHYQWCSKNGSITIARVDVDASDTAVEIEATEDSLKGTYLYP